MPRLFGASSRRLSRRSVVIVAAAALACASRLWAVRGASGLVFTSAGETPRSGGVRKATGVVQPQAPETATQQQEEEQQLPGLLASIIRPDEDYVEELFQKYDDDGSGQIDREEFSAIAHEMHEDAQRRTVLAMLASGVGAGVVAQYSTEYQIFQRTFRGLYVDRAAEAKMFGSFPTAKLSADVVTATTQVLATRGFTADNTLFAHSVCPDEVNAKAEELVSLMTGQWGEAFTLGGLAGVPFAGKSGFGAYLHHTPEKGKILVMFAPHVGITADGQVGAVQRFGQTSISTACGAALGAYTALRNGGAVDPSADFDEQLDYIKQKMLPKLVGIADATDEIAYVSYQNYAIARDLLFETLAANDDVFNWAEEVAILGGIMINRKTGGDFFQPMLFQSRTKDGQTLDLFDTAFGKKPDLSKVLGSEAASKTMF